MPRAYQEISFIVFLGDEWYKPKVFGIRLVMASCGRKSFFMNLQSSFTLSFWRVLEGTVAHENLEPAGALLVRKWTENCKEKEKWQPVH